MFHYSLLLFHTVVIGRLNELFRNTFRRVYPRRPFPSELWCFAPHWINPSIIRPQNKFSFMPVYFISCFVSECCKLLIVSLDQAPFDAQNIPTLFYLAETVLYTIRTNSTRRSRLTTFKSQLLTIGRLTLERVYFHHIAGQLAAYTDLKSNLCSYLDGTSTH